MSPSRSDYILVTVDFELSR